MHDNAFCLFEVYHKVCLFRQVTNDSLKYRVKFGIIKNFTLLYNGQFRFVYFCKQSLKQLFPSSFHPPMLFIYAISYHNLPCSIIFKEALFIDWCKQFLTRFQHPSIHPPTQCPSFSSSKFSFVLYVIWFFLLFKNNQNSMFL